MARKNPGRRSTSEPGVAVSLPVMSDTTPRGHVLITGASTGIGRATAIHLASLGFHVFAGVRRDADGQSLESDGGGNIKAVRIDVADDASIATAFETIRATVADDGLLGLVNNAGIGIVGPIEYISRDDWHRQFDVNVFGHIAVTQSALPLLRAHVQRHGRGAARIVNMSSIAGKIATPIVGPYSASKFALEAVSDSLRLELRPQGILVCLVNPGAIDTPIWKKGEASEAAIPADHPARELYGSMIDRVTNAAKNAAKSAIPPIAVAKAVEACLTGRRPKIRTFVGRDARAGAIAKAIIPDRFFDAFLARYYGVPKQ
jgi:NAD(P)-dependent dehydrogenase (short-subunit alcohol dehydrogenase family)